MIFWISTALKLVCFRKHKRKLNFKSAMMNFLIPKLLLLGAILTNTVMYFFAIFLDSRVQILNLYLMTNSVCFFFQDDDTTMDNARKSRRRKGRSLRNRSTTSSKRVYYFDEDDESLINVDDNKKIKVKMERLGIQVKKAAATATAAAKEKKLVL